MKNSGLLQKKSVTTKPRSIRPLLYKGTDCLHIVFVSIHLRSFVLEFALALFTMPAAFRTLVPLLRTARHSARIGYAANPVQFALRRQTVESFRGYAEAFKRDKPHVNIGVQLWQFGIRDTNGC
jgi:hypothetical protein